MPSADSRRAFLAAAAATAAAAPIGAQTAAHAETQRPASPPAAIPSQRRSPAMSNGEFSKSRLARMHDVMVRHVDGGRMPGLVTLISRRGDTQVDEIGAMSFDDSTPMRRDSIFRVASLTKPITATAAMMLVEDGVLRLDDPVDALLPELKDRKVLRALDSPLDDTVPAKRAITLRDLLTFRAGYGAVMVFPDKYPIQKAMTEAGIAPSARLFTGSADELMQRFGALPLLHQPGEQWLYHSASDILGVLIARASGQTLDRFLTERLFAPLGMKDTGFSVPAAKIDRLPVCYETDFKTGQRVVFDEAKGGRFAKPPSFESGGGGLVSTVDDYLAFAIMMLGQGRYGRERILSRASIELMTTDHITPAQKAGSPFASNFWDNRGWGFGLSIITRRDDLAGTPGRFGWDGGYGTSAYMDPEEDLIGILMTQRLWESPTPPAVITDFWTQAYQAIDD